LQWRVRSAGREVKVALRIKPAILFGQTVASVKEKRGA
jgi:hypothetical protein